MRKPIHLKKGDTIAIVATARKVNKKELQPGITLLKSWGLQVILGSSIGIENHQFAGTDKQRAVDFQTQMDNPKIKAIWCARGGYGTVRILDLLDFSTFKNNPKWVIGYSDITAFHSHIHQMNIETIHAEMPALIADKTPETKKSLKKGLFGESLNYEWDSFELNRNGTAKGELIGGNLSMLYSLCGSAAHINPENKILFFEDLDEYLYHIDRMMQNLKRNKWFEKCAGVVVGGMTDMNDNTTPFGKTAKEIIADTLKAYNFPVAYNFPAGHVKNNRALIFGAEVRLSVHHKKSTLKFEQ